MAFLDYLSTNWDHVLERAIGHAIVVAVSLAIAVVIAVPLGVLVYRRERAASIALGITGVCLTISSLALFGIFIPILGLGYTPAVVALVMYALLLPQPGGLYRAGSRAGPEAGTGGRTVPSRLGMVWDGRGG